MIRPNPTAIPLRPSDLKHLQAELEKRKTTQDQPATSNTAPAKKLPVGRNVVEEKRTEKQGRSTAERIGA
jgi:hypothetical protein